MHTALDTTGNVTPYLSALKTEGVKGISRYIASGGAYKLIHKPEIDAIHAQGMDVFLNFEGRGNDINFFSDSWGKNDATLSLNCAKNELGAPQGTAIFFSCEPENSTNLVGDYNSRVLPYYLAAKAVLGSQYRIGAYTFGTYLDWLLRDKAIDFCWLPGASGWAGYAAFKASNRWAFRQLTPSEGGLEQNFHGLQVDWDEINPTFTDNGAWKSDGVIQQPNQLSISTTIPPTIRKGSTGADVKHLQVLLVIVIDGIFGNDTEKAVKTFQHVHNLFVDGVVGPQTWTTLLKGNIL